MALLNIHDPLAEGAQLLSGPHSTRAAFTPSRLAMAFSNCSTRSRHLRSSATALACHDSHVASSASRGGAAQESSGMGSGMVTRNSAATGRWSLVFLSGKES